MSVVYFVRPVGMDGPIKIGVSARVPRRVASLSLASPLPLEVAATVDGGFELEAHLHKHLRRHRSHGEWFRPEPEVLALVAAARRGLAEVVDAVGQPSVSTNPALDSIMRECGGAEGIAKRLKVRPSRVHVWTSRKSIPRAIWPELIAAYPKVTLKRLKAAEAVKCS